MRDIRAQLWADDQVLELDHGLHEQVLPATQVTILLTGVAHKKIFFDGVLQQPRRLNDQAILAVDLHRSTGFHHLLVPNEIDCWFGTQDSKSGLAGIREMLTYLDRNVLRWTGQALFSDGSGIRDSHVVYGFLDQNADQALTAIEAIAKSPVRGRQREWRRTRTANTTISPQRSNALWRRRPKEYLEESPDGPIEIAGTRYVPLEAVGSHRKQTLWTTANRRAVALAQLIRSLASELTVQATTPELKTRCADWAQRARVLAGTPPLHELSKGPSRPLSSLPDTVELADTRYRETYRVSSLVRNLGWKPQVPSMPIHAAVPYADELYQEFVAHILAEQLLLEANERTTGPRYESSEWELYVDVSPPLSLIRTWRSYTTSPDDYRPDFILHHRASGDVLLADAKYRNRGPRASESSRKDLHAYMSAYGLATSLILFPPNPSNALSYHEATYDGYHLGELTVAPTPYLPAFLEATLPTTIQRLLRPPTWPPRP